eukprot:340753-Amphidinium_carterae.1
MDLQHVATDGLHVHRAHCCLVEHQSNRVHCPQRCHRTKNQNSKSNAPQHTHILQGGAPKQ